jgi:hypothetical protein
MLDTLHVVIISQGLYRYLITDFGDYNAIVSLF